jgi:hypothetical protein
MGWGGWYDAKLPRSHSTQKKTWQEQFRDIKICRPQLHHHWLDAGDLEVCFSNSSSLFCVLISLFSASASSSRNCSIILSFWRRRLVLGLVVAGLRSRAALLTMGFLTRVFDTCIDVVVTEGMRGRSARLGIVATRSSPERLRFRGAVDAIVD